MESIKKRIKKGSDKLQQTVSEGYIESQVVKALIAARMKEKLTQKELAEKSGIRQSNISRIENGSSSPTIATLERIAKGMGKKIKITFE